MDFQSLSRRDLQALCKKNKIPANITNVAMVEALSSLEKVEGLDELMNEAKSESPVKVPASPANPQTACRTSTRRKVKVVEPESSKVGTRTRRATRKTDGVESKEEKENVETPVAPTTRRRENAASACRKLEIQGAETETVEKPTGDEEHESLAETPAVQSRRRRAPIASALKKQEAQKEICPVQRAYSTRRSVRLLEKSMGNLSLTENEEVEKNADAEVLNNEIKKAEEKEENQKLENTSTEELNNENQNREVEDKEENVPGVDSAKTSEEILLTDAFELPEVTQESEIDVMPEAVLEKSESLIDSSEIDAEDEDKIVSSGLSSVVIAVSSEMTVDDACGSVEVCEIKDEVQAGNQKEQDVSVTETDVTSNAAPESEMGKPLKENFDEMESVEVSTDLIDDIAGEQNLKPDDISSSLNIEEFMAENEQHGEMERLSNGRKDLVESVEVLTDFMDETATAQISKPDDIGSTNVQEFMAESEKPGSDDPDTKLVLNGELDSSQPEEHQQSETFMDGAEEDSPGSLLIESSANKELGSRTLTKKTEMDLEDVPVDYDIETLIDIDITETKEEFSTTSNVSDAPEFENNAGYPQVPETEVTGAFAVSHDSSETLIEVQITQAVDNENSSCIPQTQSSSTPAKSVLSDTKKVMSPFAADTIQGQFPRPTTTLFTPTKPSAGKQQLLHSIDIIINKENIDNSGTKLEEANKGRDKNKKNLEDMSMRMLTKMLKEQLQIKNKSVDEANKIGEKVEKRRPALQTLPENRLSASSKPETGNY